MTSGNIEAFLIITLIVVLVVLALVFRSQTRLHARMGKLATGVKTVQKAAESAQKAATTSLQLAKRSHEAAENAHLAATIGSQWAERTYDVAEGAQLAADKGRQWAKRSYDAAEGAKLAADKGRQWAKRSSDAAEGSHTIVKSSHKSVMGAHKTAQTTQRLAKLVAERAGWFTPQTVGGFTADEIKAVDTQATLKSAELLEQPVDGVAPLSSGARVVLGVGEALMAGSPNSTRLNIVPDRLLAGVSYNAKMIGHSDRCLGEDTPECSPYGEPELNPLSETLVRNARLFSEAERLSGNYHPRALGATPLPAACILFERLVEEHRSAGAETPNGFDIAVNVAKPDARLEELSSSPLLDRTTGAIQKARDLARTQSPDQAADHSVTFERHGQKDEAETTPRPNYFDDHRAFRSAVQGSAGSDLQVPWIATQVSGAYASPRRQVAQAQLSMALGEPDYFIATPDYPFPHFGKAKAPHPRAGDRNPTANGMLMAAVYMAHARYKVQVLRRNWFPTHMGDAFFRGHYILVTFRAMVPPLRISPVCISTTLTMVEALGFDVEDDGVPIRIVGTPELVGELTFRIQCARELTNPIVGLAKGSFGLAETGAPGSGATNIVDSQKLEPFLRPGFEEGYTDLFARKAVDENGVEDLGDWFKSFEFGNWAVAQRRQCRPMPSADEAQSAPEEPTQSEEDVLGNI